MERSRPSSDVLTQFERSGPGFDAPTQFVPAAEPKPVQSRSPYYTVTTRSFSGTSSVSLGSTRSSVHGESMGIARGVTSESPLDLTTRKEQSMTAEAFLRRCQQDASARSSQYISPGHRHDAPTQFERSRPSSDAPTQLQYSGYQWPPAANSSGGFDPSLDVRPHPRHTVQQPGDAVRPMHSAVGREYLGLPPPLHLEQPEVRRFQMYSGQAASFVGRHHRHPDEQEVAVNPHGMYTRHEADPRWGESMARHSGLPSVTASPGVKPAAAYWDVSLRYSTRPNVELSSAESVAPTNLRAPWDSTTPTLHNDALPASTTKSPRMVAIELSAPVPSVGHAGTTAYWMGERSGGPYGGRPVVMKASETPEPQRMLGTDHHRVHEVPLASLSPQGLPTTVAGRRAPIVQLLGGKCSPNDILHLCCKVVICG